MKPEVSQPAKALDKELAIVQSLALVALTPLTTLEEYDGDLSPEVVKDAASTVMVLIGNSNAHLSHLWRERILTTINKSLLPLFKEEDLFGEVAPNLFGNNFTKQSKEFVD